MCYEYLRKKLSGDVNLKYRIIWINGAFGSGKTTCVEMLNKIINNSIIFDPEISGSMINSILPSKLKLYDFQDHKEWRIINNLLLKKLFYETTKIILIPMTITNQVYFYEILKGIPHNECKQVILIASHKTIVERLENRGEPIGSWPYQQIDNCISSFKRMNDITTINTDNLGINDVTEIIFKLLI